MKNHDNEPFLNEEYYVEVTLGDSQIVPRRSFPKLVGGYVRFPYPKDDAIRAFHKATQRYFLDGATVELWRSTPRLTLCAESTFGQISVIGEKVLEIRA
jgi:hypothetical protein